MNEFRTAYLRYGLAAVIVLASIIALQPANSVSGTYPDRSTAPVLADKHSAPSGLGAGADPLSEPIAAMLAAGGSLSTCGASGNTTWTTTSTSFEVIRQCTLSIPQAGWVFLSMDGSMAYLDDKYEARFEIGIDAATGNTNVTRWVNVYSDSGNGTDKSVALSMLKPITAGPHTFYSLARRNSGTGTVRVYDPTLTVIFIPATNSQVLACGASETPDWMTTSSSFEVIQQCTLSVPQAGWVFLSADGSLARLDGEYTARFRIGIDNTGGDSNVDRYVNIYNDSGGDGTDKSVALSVLKPITSGAHTFYSLGMRSDGTGTVHVYNPTLTAIFIPASGQILPCGASGNMEWTTTSDSFQIIRECTLSVPQAGWMLLSANSTVALQSGGYEAQFTIGIDEATAGNHDVDRWVNIYNGSGDGSGGLVALSVLKPIRAGPHTFYFLGRRTSGTGSVVLIDPTLTVIVIPEVRIYLPLVKK